MAELLVSIATPDHNIAELNLQMNTFVPVAAAAADLISADTPNNLSLGSDNKLVSQPPDIDFLAHYILASN
jgi:hypothetical protein